MYDGLNRSHEEFISTMSWKYGESGILSRRGRILKHPDQILDD